MGGGVFLESVEVAKKDGDADPEVAVSNGGSDGDAEESSFGFGGGDGGLGEVESGGGVIEVFLGAGLALEKGGDAIEDDLRGFVFELGFFDEGVGVDLLAGDGDDFGGAQFWKEGVNGIEVLGIFHEGKDDFATEGSGESEVFFFDGLGRDSESLFGFCGEDDGAESGF